jgi:hypothetical protein
MITTAIDEHSPAMTTVCPSVLRTRVIIDAPSKFRLTDVQTLARLKSARRFTRTQESLPQ